VESALAGGWGVCRGRGMGMSGPGPGTGMTALAGGAGFQPWGWPCMVLVVAKSA